MDASANGCRFLIPIGRPAARASPKMNIQLPNAEEEEVVHVLSLTRVTNRRHAVIMNSRSEI